ncbi:molybdenum cofactor synthesis domain-containing protein [Methanobrevibacter olleyae]|uniref:molybdopterin molybdotransferase n=1 Tax=Methanobrevibacter olleyae TaxID=294671 RepID=A0A126R1D2_METOL|nr:gephyrin-like molybdotransferase Glp [Methanobrevibacter olleyae]AMK15878.1 molybdopterin biosynthesis protein MoeA2 [Methanobrevibacter olleyae]SFL21227.1 molybdopterin molybdotransferase [Methanobrevibacter olleyae]
MGVEFLKIKEVDEAKEIINEKFNEYYTPQPEVIDISDSNNRITFSKIESKIDFPPFNRSLKDGFAIKAEDSYGVNEENPKKLKVIDFLEAGSFSDKTVELGKSVEISTGAPIPDGADAVVMVEFSNRAEENSELEEDEIEILTSVTPSQDIGQKGSDVKKGQVILDENILLNPPKIGVIAAQGINTVNVYKKPKVGIISTGNELLTNQEELKPGKIYDVNSEMIKAGVNNCGAEGRCLGIVKDIYDDLKTKIQESLKECDILLCSGGTSAGVGDNIRDILDELGEVYIHGITVQPGKPTILGVVDGKIVIGLPGNPVSAIVIFNVFVAPSIKKLAGFKEEEEQKTIKGTLARRIHSPIGRMQYQLVRVEDDTVYPIFKDSGAIFSLASAAGYTKVSKQTELLEEGEEVEVILFN